jgi:O-antigen/teichoic acid export membrane protein
MDGSITPVESVTVLLDLASTGILERFGTQLEILNGLPDRQSLKGRVLSAGVWSLVGFGLNYAIRLGSSLVMTRLLVPQMFGVMAIAQMVLMGLAMFSDVGLTQNIIQSRRGADPIFLNTAWSVQILRGLLLWLRLSVYVGLGVY